MVDRPDWSGGLPVPASEPEVVARDADGRVIKPDFGDDRTPFEDGPRVPAKYNKPDKSKLWDDWSAEPEEVEISTPDDRLPDAEVAAFDVWAKEEGVDLDVARVVVGDLFEAAPGLEEAVEALPRGVRFVLVRELSGDAPAGDPDIGLLDALGATPEGRVILEAEGAAGWDVLSAALAAESRIMDGLTEDGREAVADFWAGLDTAQRAHVLLTLGGRADA